MASSFRALVFLLVLALTGVLPAAAELLHDADCAEANTGRSDGDCEDCSDNCAICICCPLRGAPVRASFRVAVTESMHVLAPPAAPARIAAGFAADIFHPPRV